MKKIISIFIIISIFSTKAHGAENSLPEVEAKAAVLMDFDTGRVLYEKNMNEQLSMASTTKIMTAIIALENGKMDDVVTVSKRAAMAPPVKMYLHTGEEIHLKTLMLALMMQSSNDAAVAIAEHVGGSVEAFCDMMTQKAKEIGAVNTSFKTPSGLDAEDHYSTAYDLGLIARYALRNEEFVKLINTREVDIAKSGEKFRSYHFTNKNRLLYEYDGALGVKTGFTGKAGQCFVGAAKRGDLELISVVLASGWGDRGKERKWIDTKGILNYGFKKFKHMELVTSGQPVKQVNIKYAKTNNVALLTKNNFSIPVSEEELSSLKIIAYAPSSMEAPVEKNKAYGYLKVFIKGEEAATIDLIADADILRHDFNTSLQKIIEQFMNLDVDVSAG